MTTQEDRQTKLNQNRGSVVPVQLARIVRRTSRFEATLNWYKTVLGVEVVVR